MKQGRGFTLVELLAVIAVIAVLAAILFPVFNQAKQKAKAAHNTANLKQLGASMILYSEDHDGTLPNWSDWAYNASNSLPDVPGGLDAPGSMWDDKVRPYLGQGAPPPGDRRFEGILRSPSAEEDSAFRSYGLNQMVVFEFVPGASGQFSARSNRWRLFNLSQASRSATTLLIGDGGREGRLSPPRNWDGWKDRHEDKVPYFRREAPWRYHEGASYVFLDGHVKWMAGKELYKGPHMIQDRQKLFGINHCDMAQWFVPTEAESEWHKQVAEEGYSVKCL